MDQFRWQKLHFLWTRRSNQIPYMSDWFLPISSFSRNGPSTLSMNKLFTLPQFCDLVNQYTLYLTNGMCYKCHDTKFIKNSHVCHTFYRAFTRSLCHRAYTKFTRLLYKFHRKFIQNIVVGMQRQFYIHMKVVLVSTDKDKTIINIPDRFWRDNVGVIRNVDKIIKVKNFLNGYL